MVALVPGAVLVGFCPAGLKLGVSITLSTSNRSSMFFEPPTSKRLMAPTSNRLNQGASTMRLRGAQSPALT